jgi:hypothetical protein
MRPLLPALAAHRPPPCSSALPAAQGTILLPNSEILLSTSDWPRFHLPTSILLIYGSTLQHRHPHVRPLLTSTLAFSVCSLVALAVRVHLQVSQSLRGLTRG